MPEQRNESSAACPRCGGEQSVSALGVVICENGCHKEPSTAHTVLVCGSREYPSTSAVMDAIHALPPGTKVIHGDCQGPDRVAAATAKELGLTVEAFPADWKQHGKRAGVIRNLAMLERKPGMVLAFWDGKSKGTAHTIREARKRRIPVAVIDPPEVPA